MRMIDARCRACGAVSETLQRNTSVIDPCKCGGARERIYTSAPVVPSAVQGDDIPGGRVYKHGICWPDGRPRTFYTEHEVRDAMKKEGLVPLEQEFTVTTDEQARNFARPGYENSKRPLACPGTLSPEDEAARVRAWHDHEVQLARDTTETPGQKTARQWGESAMLRELERK